MREERRLRRGGWRVVVTGRRREGVREGGRKCGGASWEGVSGGCVSGLNK